MPSVHIEHPANDETLAAGKYTVDGTKDPKSADVSLIVTEKERATGIVTTTTHPYTQEPKPGRWEKEIPVKAGRDFELVARLGAVSSDPVKCKS